MMKILYTVASLCLFISISNAQNKHTKKADMLFNGYQYVDAIEAYLEVVESNQADDHVYKQLGDSYYNVFNTSEAAKWYAKAVISKQDAETYYRYAQVLKTQGKYEEANMQMQMFADMKPNDQRAKTYLQNPNYVSGLMDTSNLYDVEVANINDSEHSDFGAVLSNDNVLYFVSTRNKSTKEDPWTKSPYLDVYQSVRKADGTLSDPEQVKSLNTPYHDGPITLSADGKTMIFARDGHSEGVFKKENSRQLKVGQQGLYKATLVDGKWTDIKPLPFNSVDYSVSHPSLSSDGKTLYFTSNMPGGLGDTDIWKVSVNGNQYGTPQNLGPTVNTPGKESFPFISDNTILYFASSGRQGLGGFDIFRVDLNKGENAINLGNAVNTKRDDFAFSMNTLHEIAYFSSNRTGVDNIYIAIPICHVDLSASIKDANSGHSIAGATVVLKDSQQNVIDDLQSNEDGEAEFNVLCKLDYNVSISKEGYDSMTIPVTGPKKDPLTLDVSLNPINEMITATEVKLNTIYFEFNKSNITQQGAFELDKLVKIMKDYPEMTILVKSHSDTKGSADYNFKLSEERAQSTVQYLISKGIAKERLSAKGMGSTQPKVDCQSNCTEAEDAQNRRSEFLIVKT